MANFEARQSLNGLDTFSLFTAPDDGVYFVNGQLTLPPLSQVVAEVDVNGSPSYTGDAGCTGFQINQLELTAGDVVEVVLSSSDAVDAPLNVVKGVVAMGNTF